MTKKDYSMNSEEIEHVEMFDKLVKEHDYPELFYTLGLDRKTGKRRLIVVYHYEDDIIALAEVFYPGSEEAKDIDFSFNENDNENLDGFTYKDRGRKPWYKFWE